MPGAPPYGNRNAEKWSFRKSVKLFHDAIDLTNQKEELKIVKCEVILISTGYEFDFIGELAAELGTFKEVFTHLTKRFPALQRLKSQLDNNIERNCYNNAKKGFIREATGIVNLKSNWKWTDRVQTDIDLSTTRKTIDELFPSDEDFIK